MQRAAHRHGLRDGLHGDATTDACAALGSPVLPYLEQLFERDIVHMTADLSCERAVVTPVYTEWLARLQHRHFGLSTFFIAQNASQKLGIRIVPSIHAALAAGEAPSTFVAFAIAAMLRFLTPVGEQPHRRAAARLRRQARPPAERCRAAVRARSNRRPRRGLVRVCRRQRPGAAPLRPLGRGGGTSAVAVASITKQVLTAIDGLFARTDAPIVALVGRVADLLRRMLGGEGACDVLHSLDPSQPLLIPPAKLRDAVGQEVDAAEAIDVHAHCFAAEYGDKLMAFGVDKLLTAGYGDADLACSPDLVAQYLAISDDTPDAFAALPVEEQANRVWRALFVERSPLSGGVPRRRHHPRGARPARRRSKRATSAPSVGGTRAGRRQVQREGDAPCRLAALRRLIALAVLLLRPARRLPPAAAAAAALPCGARGGQPPRGRLGARDRHPRRRRRATDTAWRLAAA